VDRGNSEAALRRPARSATGWLPQRAPDEEAGRMVERVLEHAGGRPGNRRDRLRGPDDVGTGAATGLGGVRYRMARARATHLWRQHDSSVASPDEHIAVLGDVIKALG